MLKSCRADLNATSVKIATKDSRPVSVKIAAAPSAYPFAIYDV
jgi:hypothetical protein